jgi:hypothetical protein
MSSLFWLGASADQIKKTIGFEDYFNIANPQLFFFFLGRL